LSAAGLAPTLGSASGSGNVTAEGSLAAAGFVVYSGSGVVLAVGSLTARSATHIPAGLIREIVSIRFPAFPDADLVPGHVDRETVVIRLEG
jgi:hypothetical protein